MVDAITRLVVDCSGVVKWKIPTEDHAAAAEALFVDWEHQVVDVSVPNHFPSEVISAFLWACRRDRITEDEAREAIRDLLALPFVVCDVTALADRAFAITYQHQQRAYDCLYVALAEWDGAALWTGDERLYNALHAQHPCVRWIADLEWEAHDAVDPFFRCHRAPDEEQILNDLPSREALWYQDHTSTRMLTDECRKMPGHRADIVRQ